MSRRRINTAAICSSYHYQESRQLHKEYLEKTHKGFVGMNWEVKNPKVTHNHCRAFIMVLGKKMYLKGTEIEKAVSAGFAVHYE